MVFAFIKISTKDLSLKLVITLPMYYSKIIIILLLNSLIFRRGLSASICFWWSFCRFVIYRAESSCFCRLNLICLSSLLIFARNGKSKIISDIDLFYEAVNNSKQIKFLHLWYYGQNPVTRIGAFDGVEI